MVEEEGVRSEGGLESQWYRQPPLRGKVRMGGVEGLEVSDE